MSETRSKPFAEADADQFSVWLQERVESEWEAATSHRFTEELAADTLSDEVFRAYLRQDYAFLEVGASVTAFAAAQAPSMGETRRLSEALSVLTGEENDYFQRSFDALDVPESEWRDPDLRGVTRTFRDHLVGASRTGGYEETLAVILAAEWVYLDWASATEGASPSRFYLDEWITLHANPSFEGYVQWLRSELDRYGPTLAPNRQERVADLFARTVDLEVAFFDAAYDWAGGD